MKTRLYVAGVLGGVAVLIALAVVVLQFGISHPSPPSLKDHPHDEIAGSILYVDGDGCIVNAAASGRRAEKVICTGGGAGFVQMVTWIDPATIAYWVMQPSLKMPSGQWTRVDLSTKTQTSIGTVSTVPMVPIDMLSPRGERISFGPDGYIYRDSDGSDRVRIYKLSGGQGGGQLGFESWSPDGEWFLMRYYPNGELWIIRRDGSSAGTLAEGVAFNPPSWIIPGVGVLPSPNPPPSTSNP